MRRSPEDARMAYLCKEKEKGNRLYTETKDYDAAREVYERALSTVLYVKNLHPDWKKKGIYDEDLTVVSYAGDGEEQAERDAFVAMKTRLLVNIGLCCLKTKRWTEAREAFDYVLNELNPRHVKALYHRARTRTLPPSAGATEHLEAIRDLKKAASIDPDHRATRALLTRLVRTMKRQRETDRKTFAGLFARGRVVNADDDATEAAVDGNDDDDDVEMFRRQMNDLERVAKTMEAEGKTKESNELRDHLDRVREKARRDAFGAMDFSKPTPAMVRDAEKMGLDLNDPKVQDVLRTMQARHKDGASFDDIASELDASALNEDPERSPTTFSWRDALVSARTLIYPTMIAVLLYRLYALGILSWLAERVLSKDASEAAVEDDPFGDW